MYLQCQYTLGCRPTHRCTLSDDGDVDDIGLCRYLGGSLFGAFEEGIGLECNITTVLRNTNPR
jgi:hypothetical protein